MGNRIVNFIAEFDGTGQPTGKTILDGEPHTFTVSDAPDWFAVPPIDGKSATKIWVAWTCTITGQVPKASTAVVSVDVESPHKGSDSNKGGKWTGNTTHT